jgi:hypothetical protein
LITPRPAATAPVSAAQVGELRVLGAAPVAAPAGGFDPAAALVATTSLAASSPLAAAPSSPTLAPTGSAPRSLVTTHRATPPRMRPERATPDPDPETRWRAAVAARPLEAARPFPAALRPLVSAVTGAERASYTTGPATRQALTAAGAHGATTGSVVHLPAAPTPAPGPLLGVIAHELAHARNPVSRPRFLLEVPDGAADADERTALSVGRRFQSIATGGGDAIRAGIVDELPVGGLGRVGGIASQARTALAGGGADFGETADDAVSGAASLTENALSGGASMVASSVGMPGADLSSAAGSAVAGAASAAMNAVTGAAGGGQQSTVDIDRLADLLEQRLLKQIERRGGRYAGVF